MLPHRHPAHIGGRYPYHAEKLPKFATVTADHLSVFGDNIDGRAGGPSSSTDRAVGTFDARTRSRCGIRVRSKRRCRLLGGTVIDINGEPCSRSGTRGGQGGEKTAYFNEILGTAELAS